MWWKRTVITALIAASSLLVVQQNANAAAGPFHPPVTVVPSCGDALADAAAGNDGAVRGFASCNLTSGSRLTYFRHRGGTVTRHTSPYTGIVRAVAWDGVNSLYVVYIQGSSLKIGKYAESTGAFAAPTVLSTHSGVVSFSADVVASHGKWWAVWSEQIGPGGEFAQTELFQRRTLNGTLGKTRITNTASNIDDASPSLAYSNGTLSMVWTRTTNPNVPGPSTLRYATTTGSGFVASTFAGGAENEAASIAVVSGRTYVSWQRGLTIWEKDNATGPWTTKRFATAGFNSSLAVSSGKVFVAWTTTGGNQRVFVAERTGATWSGATVTGPFARSLSLAATAGKATTIYTPGTDVRLRVQS